MERQANYALLGGVTIVGVILIFLFGLWIARSSFAAEYDAYDVVFEGPARGIGAGTEVRFNGIRVGEVQDLFMPEGQENQVVARIRIGSTWPVRADSEARLEPIGLTGLNLIQISPGTIDSPLLTHRMGGPLPQIPARQGALDDLLDSSEDIAANAAEALAGARDILNRENAARLDRILRNLEQISAELATEQGVIAEVGRTATALRRTADQFTATGAEIQGLSGDARRSLGALETDTRAAVVSVERAASSFSEAADAFGGVAGEAAYTTLPQLSAATANLDELTDTLERVAVAIERSPTFASIAERKPQVQVNR